MSVPVVPGTCKFVFSADVNVVARIRVGHLVPHSCTDELVGEEPLSVECDFVLDGEVYGSCRSSSFATPEASTEHDVSRPQRFCFAIKIRDLPLQCSFVIRVRSKNDPSLVYRGVLPLFNERAVLRQGQQLLHLERQEVNSDASSRSVGSDWSIHSNHKVLRNADPGLREAVRVLKMVDLLEQGALPPTMPGFQGSEDDLVKVAHGKLKESGHVWLALALPVFSHPVVFSEPRYRGEMEVPQSLLSPQSEESTAREEVKDEGACWLLRPFATGAAPASEKAFRYFVDYDAAREHPAVWKTLKLARSSKASRAKDKDLRPNPEERKLLHELIARSKRQFSAKDKEFIFRFRWSLINQKAALTKFLHAVDWSDIEEKQHGIELLNEWEMIEIDDALELLGKDFRGIFEVRQYAVKCLHSASEEDLQLYLLQLVQALRYETAGFEGADGEESKDDKGRALAKFLIERCSKHKCLATYFHWYLAAEAEDQERGHVFVRVLQQFKSKLESNKENEKMLERQKALRKKLLFALNKAKNMKRDRIEKKIEKFRETLKTSSIGEDLDGSGANLDVNSLSPSIPLPVDPIYSVKRILVDESTLFKSAMNPCLVACDVESTSGGKTKQEKKCLIYKEGDDLRQDQLVLQLIILMDNILKKYGLDLQLTPYQVIAHSTVDGMIEWVPDAYNMSQILKDYDNDMQQFLRHHNGDQKADLGIKKEVLENFIRSNAGYCVITYILGIGDRHMDNLMVTKDGHLFHIDFGFILGKDPKPFTTPMRLCKEMVEGMGGQNSAGYQNFQSKCCQAYKILRRHAKLIINLLYLMTDSGIKDMREDPSFALLKVQQKFQAEMDDEQAEEYFLQLINESVTALFPAVFEKLHKLAVAMQ